ncbi:cyanophycinase [Microbulbifer sp. SAOS-129_SWC]|uniref:cyanophycinase n=1 Tax=Microbulbifer sp. SAOS-129_SWC TaxID=3145235 RepID=UPI0032177460
MRARVFHSLLALLLTLAAGGCHAAGKLMIVGGALRSDNAEIYRAYIAAIPAQYPDVAVVPVASGRPAHYAEQFRADLQHYGFAGHVHILPVALKDDPHTDQDESRWARGAYDPAVVKQMATVGGIWFVGGDQTRITNALLRKGGGDSPLLAAIRRQLANGAVIGGTSAGAAIMSSPMIAAGDSLTALTQPLARNYAGMESQESGRLMLQPGLGFFRGGIVDQHFDRKSRLGRLVRALAQPLGERPRLGFGVDEDTAMFADLDRDELLVLGRGCVTILDARSARFVDQSGGEQSAGFAARGIGMTVLSDGDRYNWRAGTLRVHGSATAGHEAFGYRVEQGGGMALPNNRLEQMLGFSLLDNSESRELRRYTFDESGHGVRFRFRQTDDSRGYWRYGSGTKDQYSISGVKLSVEPISIDIH